MVNLEKNPKKMTKTVMISTISDVKEFSNAAIGAKCTVSLVSGRYTVDGKSIMGIFSLDLSKPIELEIERPESGADDREEFLKKINKFIVE